MSLSSQIICVSIYSVSNKGGTSISEIGKQALREAEDVVYARRKLLCSWVLLDLTFSSPVTLSISLNT